MKKNAFVGIRGATGLWIASLAAALALLLAVVGGAGALTPGGPSQPQDCQKLCDNFKKLCCGQNADAKLCSELAFQWEPNGAKETCAAQNGNHQLVEVSCGKYDTCMNIEPKPKPVKQRSECKIKCGTSTEVTVPGACCYTGKITSGNVAIFSPNGEDACVPARDNLEKITGQTCSITSGICKDDDKCGAGIPHL